MNYDFYGIDIKIPLTDAFDQSDWDQTILGRLNARNPMVYAGSLFDIPGLKQFPEYCWRIADAFFHAEDTIMTYFRAYGLDGEALPQATFGVSYGSLPAHHKIAGNWTHLVNGNRQYIPVENKFTTRETGGYVVQLLDPVRPSEPFYFGHISGGRMGDNKVAHHGMVISWRLFPFDAMRYPHDVPGQWR